LIIIDVIPPHRDSRPLIIGPISALTAATSSGNVAPAEPASSKSRAASRRVTRRASFGDLLAVNLFQNRRFLHVARQIGGEEPYRPQADDTRTGQNQPQQRMLPPQAIPKQLGVRTELLLDGPLVRDLLPPFGLLQSPADDKRQKRWNCADDKHPSPRTGDKLLLFGDPEADVDQGRADVSER
jgi:hypothetical protein